MGAQAEATERWAAGKHLANIESLCRHAVDYSFPAGQAQAGIQLATVEVPWLLAHIEELKEQINGTAQEPPQELAV